MKWEKAVSALLALPLLMTTCGFAYSGNAQSAYTQFDSNIPGVTGGMFVSDFWADLDSYGGAVVMNSAQIEDYNRKNLAIGAPYADLRNYPRTFNQKELTEKIHSLSSEPKESLYGANGKKLSRADDNAFMENLNLDRIGSANPVQYGITVRRTDMRTFPTATHVFSQGDQYEFDVFQETAVYALEPLAILWTSKDGKWYFAQMYNYLAWIPAADVALTDRDALFRLVDAQDFLVVTGNSVKTDYNALCSGVSEVQMDMGVRVPLASKSAIGDKVFDQNPAGNYVVNLPTRDRSGRMAVQQALLPVGSDVHVGYLPYTNDNIVREAFKGLGERYGWGGTFDGRDCSATVMDAYRTVGVNLPRNTGEQEKIAAGVSESMKGMSRGQREQLFRTLQPGTALYMSGHAMIYIGEYNGEPYMIHDFSGFYQNGLYYRSRELIVTPVEIEDNAAGTVTFMDVLTSAKRFVLPSGS